MNHRSEWTFTSARTFSAFPERVGAAGADGYPSASCRQGEQFAALAINRMAIAQPREHADKQDANARTTIGGTFQTESHYGSFGSSRSHGVASYHEERPLIHPTNKFYMTSFS